MLNRQKKGGTNKQKDVVSKALVGESSKQSRKEFIDKNQMLNVSKSIRYLKKDGC
jgi:hypothetical protein